MPRRGEQGPEPKKDDTMNDDVFSVVAAENQDLRFHDNVKEFQGAPQGDILITRIASADEAGLKALEKIMQAPEGFGPNFRFGKLGPKTKNLQLVSGDSMGSRHCIRGEDASVVTVYAPDPETANPLEGPTIVAEGRFVVTHPEHAWHSLPEGTYKVTYSRDLAADQLRAIED